VAGPERDLHSGNDGGVFHEPMADLVQLLGSLHGPGGKISVPGFHNSVRPQLMELAWQGLEHSEEFSMSSYRCVRVCSRSARGASDCCANDRICCCRHYILHRQPRTPLGSIQQGYRA
jgi:hypothetical protein